MAAFLIAFWSFWFLLSVAILLVAIRQYDLDDMPLDRFILWVGSAAISLQFLHDLGVF